MTKQTHTAARIGTEDLQAIARQGVERALAARKALTELSPEQTQQVAGAGGTVIYGGSVVPGWWIYGKPAFATLGASQIASGINQVNAATLNQTQLVR